MLKHLLVAGLLAWNAFVMVRTAASRAFWYDEICTVIVSSQPERAKIWTALQEAADTNPPVYAWITRASANLTKDPHIGYRLPSIAGFTLTALCLYLIVLRFGSPVAALVAIALLAITPLPLYATEARPYALMLGFTALAALAWDKVRDSGHYSFLLAAALGCAVSLHYYAILVLPAFAIAELVVLLVTRRIRFGVWAAFAVAIIPLVLFRELLASLSNYYGRAFWATPSFSRLPANYGWLFHIDKPWAGLAALVFLALVVALHRKKLMLVEKFEVPALALALLTLPVYAVTAAKIAGSGMTDRYMLPATLGGILFLGFLVSCMRYPLAALAAIAPWIWCYGLPPLPGRLAVLQESTAIASLSADLPVVIASGLRYLPYAYYASQNAPRKLLSLTNPAVARNLTGTDSIDLELIVLARYFPLEVADYSTFTSAHRQFLMVVWPGDPFVWLPQRLEQDHPQAKVLAERDGYTAYLVTLPR